MLSLRPLTRADAELVHSLVRASEQGDDAPIVTPLEEIEEYWDDSAFSDVDDGRIAELDGEPVGYGVVSHHPSGERLERAHMSGTVHPAHRRKGVGEALLAWQIERGVEQMAGYQHGLPCYVQALRAEEVTGAGALFEQMGLEPVRWFDEMARPLDDVPEVTVPDGIEIVPWSTERSRETLECKNLAWRDHWGGTRTSSEEWAQWQRDYSVRIDLSAMALAGDRVVGIVLNNRFPSDDELTGRVSGWIGLLAVDREWRRRGVASALITHSLHAFLRADLTHAMIGVDSENPTGAHGLYRSLGFDTVNRNVLHRRRVC